MHQILAAVDLSDSSLPVLAASADLARLEHAELSILYTMPMALPLAGVPWNGGAYVPATIAEENVESDASLERLQAMAKANGAANANCLCERGAPVERIREVAERIHADLIVLGSHGHGRFFHTMFGSVREDLLASPPCPVMVIPTHATAS